MKNNSNKQHISIYEKIYLLVSQVPPGQVATYGQIAKMVGSCTPRMVGYAMAALPSGSDIPWQRVINSQGGVSPRSDGNGDLRQRLLLEAEGVVFGENGRTDLEIFGWEGPGLKRPGDL
ncbi:MAG: MGMT family protein [Calditrichaceae bacterium]